MNKSIFWFRRDLRLSDNAGLATALQEQPEVWPIFIFDTTILGHLTNPKDARVTFIHQQIAQLKKELQHTGSDLTVFVGDPVEVIQQIIDQNKIEAIYTNRDYEPSAIARDKKVYTYCEQKGIKLVAKKDHVIFDRNEVLKADGKPYTVYTPYSRKWREYLKTEHYQSKNSEKLLSQLAKVDNPQPMISLSEIGFEPSDLSFPGKELELNLVRKYKEQRDFPAKRGTSRLGLHLRFGTISIRQLVRDTIDSSSTFINELIWRDFYQMIIYHFPKSVSEAFKPKYDWIKWEFNEAQFQAWCEGKTGYPLVDAGMRELNATGFMHNRVRMVTASFLTKHLLHDWRLGEAYFAEKLLDYDQAANVGGWQWAAGSGCDAAPYFRVFNPYLQQKKFDPNGTYVRKWVPEVDDPFRYPKPIVDHPWARKRALERYAEALKGA